MSEAELPAHLTVFLTDLQADPTLVQGAKAAVGELKDAAAVEAAAAYYQSKGYQISVEELTALEIARKQAVGEPLSDHELEAVSGGSSASHMGFDLSQIRWIASSLSSDRRLKEAIVEVGVDAGTGLVLYEFAYCSDPSRRFRGVMADEVEVVMPDAVTVLPSGFRAVDYGRLRLQMTEITAN
jgi:hypothetical protein